MLDLAVKREDFFLDPAPGVRIKVRPCTSALILAARSVLSPTSDNGELVRALARLAIIEWEGITFDGEPAPVTPENIEAILALWPIYRAFENDYFGAALLLEDEKKG